MIKQYNYMKMISMIPKALFSAHPIFDRMLNPAHESNQSVNDWMKYGSRSRFQTDLHINGEYFRSRTNNQYFCIIDKNEKIGDLTKRFADFRPLDVTMDCGTETNRIPHVRIEH